LRVDGDFYVVSAWLKASAPMKVTMGMNTGSQQDVFLIGTTWQRYSTVISCNTDSYRDFRLFSVDTSDASFDVYGMQSEHFASGDLDWDSAQQLRQANWSTRAVLANDAYGATHTRKVRSSIEFQFKDQLHIPSDPIHDQFGLTENDGTHTQSYAAFAGLTFP
jgi:hypothetical protein